jgi:dihydrodipicolinate synthase/N-acetylneuraminate lyase
MTRYVPTEIRQVLGSGLLSFPVTHFTANLGFDEAAYRDNLGWLSSYSVAGLFVAGGTGEFFSLTPPEVARVVRAGVAETADSAPIVAPAGYGTAQAIDMAGDIELMTRLYATLGDRLLYIGGLPTAETFALPYIEIRDRRPGYAVSIVKAGMHVIGRPAGPVRPSLTDLTTEERATLATLIQRAGMLA